MTLGRAVPSLAFLALTAGTAAGAERPSRAEAPSGDVLCMAQSFDAVTAPALPAGWFATNAQGPGPLWVTQSLLPDSAPNAAAVEVPNVVSDKRLDSIRIPIVWPSTVLSFHHAYSFDEGLDGGVLEISVDGGPFTGTDAYFFDDKPDVTIDSVENPLHGGLAWSGDSGGYVTSSLGFEPFGAPSAALGRTVVFRWRMGSDGGGPAGFWWIDTITLTSPCILPDRIHIDEHASTNGPVGTVFNGVLEPNETVVVEPSHSNDGDSAVLLTGSAGIFGPDGANYTILDDAADYGALIPGVFSDCYTAGNNCYLAYVSDPATRPEAHWDALLSESLSASAYKLWNLHIGDSFADAPSSSAFYPFIENIFHNGVTGGCGEGLYCPGEATLRKQMAVFVLKAKFGRSYEPRACTGAFTDVPCPGTFTDWIEDLYARGIVAGCGPGPAYCPDNPVSRQQMAVFLLKTLNGSGYTPPACVGTFPDVPCTNPFAPWIEDLADRQITGGCGGGNYCPTAATTRGQMAPFLVKTFGLLLYGS